MVACRPLIPSKDRPKPRKPLNLKKASLNYLNTHRGELAGNVETRRGNFTYDLHGLFDIVSLTRNGACIGVQVTDHTHYAKHVRDMIANPRLKIWDKYMGQVELHIFRRHKDNGLWLQVYDYINVPDFEGFVPRGHKIHTSIEGYLIQ